MCCYNSVDRLSAAGAMSLVVARHGLVAFCDDDNWLAKDFVQVAFDTMRTQPRAAEIGSQGTAEIAGDAPPWFARYAHDYALGPQGDALSSSEDRELCYALRLLGHEVHNVEELRFRHEISARRLQWSCFLTMVEMAHRTVPIMAAYRARCGATRRPTAEATPGTLTRRSHRRRWT